MKRRAQSLDYSQFTSRDLKRAAVDSLQKAYEHMIEVLHAFDEANDVMQHAGADDPEWDPENFAQDVADIFYQNRLTLEEAQTVISRLRSGIESDLFKE